MNNFASTTANHGHGLGAIAIAFSMEGMYGDGMNLYQYLGSNPWTNSDPLGLSSDPFADIDALIDEIYGNRAAILSGIGKEAAAAAVIAANIASYLPFPGVGLAGDLALGQESMDQVLMGAAIGIIPGGKLVKLLKKSDVFQHLGRVGSAAWSYAKKMAGSGGGGFLRKAGGLAATAAGWVARKATKLVGAGKCGCFTASTLVLTANGAVPIVDIEQGQQVFSAAEDGLSQDYSLNAVGAKIVIGEASLVQLVVLYEDGETETINTTDEHPFHVADTGEWTRGDRLQVGDHLSTISSTAELLGVVYTTERVPVYNLSIPGSPTYYVGEHGVWVHNCDLAPLTRSNFRKNLHRLFPKPGPGYHARHIIPHEWAHLFPDLNLNDPRVNGSWVNEATHISGITAEWRRWKTINPNPSAQEVRNQVEYINGAFAGSIITP